MLQSFLASDLVFGWGVPLLVCDTKPCFFSSQTRRGVPLPSCDTKPKFCVRTRLWTPKLDFDTYAMPETFVW